MEKNYQIAPEHGPSLRATQSTARTDNLVFLPLELLLLITDLLDVKSHSRLTRTCRHLRNVLQRHLFRSHNQPGQCRAMAYGCRTGSLPIINRALDYHVPADINAVVHYFHARQSGGLTPLTIAVMWNNTAAIRYLLLRHADVNRADGRGYGPLSYTLEQLAGLMMGRLFKKQASLVPNIMRLLRAGADLRSESHPMYLFYSLHSGAPSQVGSWLAALAVDAHVSEVLTLDNTIQLIWEVAERGAITDYTGISRRAPLEWAVSEDHRPLVAHLLKHGADPNFKVEDGVHYTPLGRAIMANNVLAVRYLVENGANPAPDLQGISCSPLSLAIGHSHFDCVVALIQVGANPNVVDTARDSLGDFTPTALVSVLECEYRVSGQVPPDQLGMVRTLLHANADPNLRDPRRRTPLEVAIKNWNHPNRTSFVEELLSWGANANLAGSDNTLPLDHSLWAP